MTLRRRHTLLWTLVGVGIVHESRGKCALATKLTQVTAPEPYSLLRQGGRCPPFADAILKPGQSLSIGGASCRVDDGDVVACTDFQGHGFVLHRREVSRSDRSQLALVPWRPAPAANRPAPRAASCLTRSMLANSNSIAACSDWPH